MSFKNLQEHGGVSWLYWKHGTTIHGGACLRGRQAVNQRPFFSRPAVDPEVS
jgi:hypothetical protein